MLSLKNYKYSVNNPLQNLIQRQHKSYVLQNSDFFFPFENHKHVHVDTECLIKAF